MDEFGILAATHEVYQRCMSYEDSGTTVLYVGADENDYQEKVSGSFSTVFIRPGIMRFEYLHGMEDGEQHNFVLQSNGESIRVLRGDFSRVDVYSTLSDAVGALAGISSGVLTLNTGLLNAETGSRWFDRLRNVGRLEDEMVAGEDCHRIKGEYKNCEMTFWISKEKNIVRKVVENMEVGLQRIAFEETRKICEAEGLAWEEPDFKPMLHVTIFEEVIFNNSITIDAIGHV